MIRAMQGSRVHIIILIAFSSLLYLPLLGKPDLWNHSELRYAQVAKETLEDGHWVVPYYNGEVYYNKPPLFFCTVALISKFTGQVTELTARLPSALCALGTVVVTYFLGKHLFGPRAGLFAGLILASSPKFHSYARAVRLDTMNAFLIASALTSFYYGYTYKQRNYLLLASLVTGLAMLTKGPLILYFLGASVVCYLVYCRNLRFLLSRDSLLGIIVILLTISTWALLAYMEAGSSYFGGFVAENFTIYEEKHIHLEAIPAYIGDIFIGAAPWSFLFPLVLYRHFSNGKDPGASDPIPYGMGPSKKSSFLVIWVVVMFLSFCLTFTRRSPYLLVIYPPLAILVAQFFDTHILSLRQISQPRVYTYVLCLTAVVIGLLTGKASNNPVISTQYVVTATLVSIAFLVLVGILSLRSKSLHLLFVSSLISLSVCAVSRDIYFLPKINELVSTKVLCKEIQNLAKDGAAIGVYKEPSLHYTFYTDAHVRSIPSEDALASFLDSSERAYCLMSLEDYQSLKKDTSSLRTKELTSDKRYLAVFK
ncbi:MAG TPA: ArnT family glycosyltransferase [Candidatus Tripitaka sp. YC43]